MVVALDGYALLQLVAHDGQRILQAFGKVDILDRRLVHKRVLFNRANQVRDLGGTVLQFGKQIVNLDQRRHPFKRRFGYFASHPVQHHIQRRGLHTGFHQRRCVLPAILNSVLVQDCLDLVLQLACLQNVGLRRFHAAGGFKRPRWRFSRSE